MKRSNLEKTTQKVLLALTVLVGLSVLALGAVFVYNHYIAPAQNQVVMLPDNIIEHTREPNAAANLSARGLLDLLRPEPFAVRVELYSNHLTSNDPFDVRNMLPGDTEAKNFAVRVHHDGPLPLHFSVYERERTGTADLAGVLEVIIADLETGEVIYDGMMENLMGEAFVTLLPRSDTKMTDVYYRVAVHLPTKTGNDYQVTSHSCDFVWYVVQPEEPDPGCYRYPLLRIVSNLPNINWPNLPNLPGINLPGGAPGPGEEDEVFGEVDIGEPVDKPKTGDSDVALYVTLCIFILCLLLLLLLAKRQKREEEEVEA